MTAHARLNEAAIPARDRFEELAAALGYDDAPDAADQEALEDDKQNGKAPASAR